ncbi:hypothetical protein SCORR_v1c04040 [Spiroplasma corruscae]|uniref:Lipoprotein n=1 Tax=Spiroplasma corruscae TaxID=216934 RepID=A0A222ENV9_9MOLU|nr:lipoprotein [Spiroplasma corruscae]ASP28178.1 hypothetical protein SCORR_v1c04040 [Spiroplasma corruscae]
MKKLLGILAATGLVATTGATVVSCGDKASAFSEVKDLSMKVGDADKVVEVTVSNPVKDTAFSATSATVAAATVSVAPAKDDGTGKFKVTVKAVAEGTSDITLKYGDSLTKTFKVAVSAAEAAAKKDLSTTISTKALGEFKGAGDNPTLEELVAQVNSKNSDLGLAASDVELDGSATTSAAKLKAKSESEKFTGSVDLTYSYSKKEAVAKKDLSTITLALGAFQGAGDNPIIGELVDQVNAVNEGLGLSVNDVQLNGSPTTSAAKLDAKALSEKFTGSASLTYTYTKKEASK